jgi:LuxR family maltose regulon positive regulatory protein
LVSAPAGFGKTTLLSECVFHCGAHDRVAWVSLDKGDNVPNRFWTYVIAALQTLPAFQEAGVGEAAQAMLQSSQVPSIKGLLVGLINEIAELTAHTDHSGDAYMLVLDDYQLIAENTIHEELLFFLDNLPPQMHLVILGRADPPWPLARLRARGELAELRAPDLRFTPEEARAFLNDAMRLELSADDVITLEARTEGWIAGLQMAAVAMRGSARQGTLSVGGRRRAESTLWVSDFVRSFTGSHRFVLDYLVEEVLEQQPPAVQEFLFRTSILERMTAPLCDALLEVGEWKLESDSGAVPTPASNFSSASQQILEQLEAANLFVIPLDDERRWYRYHQLFGDLLKNRLEHRVGVQGFVPLHRRASEWYEEADLVEEAVAHAFAAGDVARAARLLEQHALAIMVRGRLFTLPQWIEALPQDQVRTRPRLCVYQAWTRYWTGSRELVEECLLNAEQALSARGERAAGATPLAEAERQQVAGYVAAIRAFQAVTSGDIPTTQDTARTASELLPEGNYMRCLATLALAGAHSSQGDPVTAQKVYAEASASARREGYRSLDASITTYLGMQQAKQGRLHEAADTYREAVDQATNPSGRQLLAAGFPLVKLGDLYREWNNLEMAGDLLHRSVEICAQWGQVDILGEGYLSRARLQLAQGDRESALSILLKGEQLAQEAQVDPYIVTGLIDCRLRLWLSAGDLDAAVRWAEASGLNVDDDLSYHHDLHHINLARVMVARGAQEPSGPYLDDALRLLDRLAAAAEMAGWVDKQIQISILRALALRTQDAQKMAIDALHQASYLAQPGGYVRTFLDEGTPMVELLQAAVARGIGAEYVAKLLAALHPSDFEDVQGAPARLRAPTLVEPLTERELEVLRLLTTKLSVPEIADQLYVAVSTVRSHTKNIYGKLGVHSRLEAVARAEELGLL